MRRRIVAFGLCTSMLWAAPAAIWAEPAPAVPKLLKIIVPFSAGASNDAIARAIAVPLARRLQTTVVVENKAGAAGVIGADAVAKSPPNGSVLLLTSSTFLTAAATQARLPFDPVTAFAPVAMVAQGPLVLAVSGMSPFKSPADLVAAASAKPGGLTYGSAGVGSVGHLATELLGDAAQVKMLHVPYKGAANALADLAGGQIDVMIGNQSSMAPLMSGGNVRPLAVTSRQPHPAFPSLPALATTVPSYAIDIWVGVLARAGTPAALVELYNREINQIASSPELALILNPDGATPVALSSAEFSKRLRDELLQWKQLASSHKIVAE